MLRQYFNPEEFKVAGEFPLLLKLRLKQLFAKKAAHGGRILVIDTCIIGDFTATLPALRLFIQNANKEVDLMVSPPLRSIAESVKGVHSVFTADSIYKRSIEQQSDQTNLPREYDLVLVLRISPRAYELLSGVKYPTIITYEFILLKYFVHLLWNISRKMPVRQWREVNFEMARVENPGRILDFDEIFSVGDARVRSGEGASRSRESKKASTHPYWVGLACQTVGPREVD